MAHFSVQQDFGFTCNQAKLVIIWGYVNLNTILLIIFEYLLRLFHVFKMVQEISELVDSEEGSRPVLGKSNKVNPK